MSGEKSPARRATLHSFAKDHLPAPMAAPETPSLKRLRLSLIWLLAGLAVMTTALVPLIALAGTAIVLLWLAMAIATPVITILWLHAKWRADEAWLTRERGE